MTQRLIQTLVYTVLGVSALLVLVMSINVGALHAAIEVEQIDVEVSRNDFVVGPGKVQLSLEPGTEERVELLVTNRLGEDREFEFTIEDAAGSQDPDQAVILLGDDRGPYSLKDYIILEEESIFLRHGERARVPVTISVPSDAEPGGLYGSVLVSTKSTTPSGDGDRTNTASSVLVTRIGTLFFITVPGDIEAEAKLTRFATIPEKNFFSEGPIRFGLWFENSGSVHLNPFGKIEIRNAFGQVVGSIESEPWFALPDSLRFRELVWERQNLFGVYTAEAVVNRGYDDIVDTQTLTFYVVPWKLIGIAFGALILFIILLRYILRSFEIKRR